MPLDELESRINSVENELKEVKGSKCEVYQRITGYYRAITNWNKGKQEEYKERKEYSMPPL